MVIGKLEPYDLATGKWPAYIRRVNQYIKLNEIKDAVKVSLLITVVGDKTYSLMCDLCSPDMPEDKTYDALVKVMTDHLEPQRSEIAERHVFRQRRQHAGEPLADYLQALKHLAATCNFGKCTTCSTLEINLRDQFVSGLASEAMRSRMFAEKKLDYKKAVELALALEAAEKHAEYRNCAHSTTGISPAEALQGRRLRSRLDALRPDRAAAVRSAQHRQEQAAPAAPRPRSLSVGDTVLARDYTAKGGKWSEGTVAKKTGPVSYKVDMGQRYLVFFDDGYAQYVNHIDTRLVCEFSNLVWEEVHPFSREFVKEYLIAYPERPMVRLHTGQSLKTEWNGKWWLSRVIQVDASLVQVYFEQDKRTEWIYRGSTRLAPLYLELQAAEKHRARPLPRNRMQNKLNMPYVEYTRLDEPQPTAADKTNDAQNANAAAIKAQQEAEIRRQRAVAKKSTAPANQPTATPNSGNLDAVTSRVVYYTPKNAVKPYKMATHTCGVKCRRTDVLALKDLRTYNPLAKPLLSGWERQIVRYKGHKEVMYRAPCGRRLRNMRELHHYLTIIGSDMGVDLFDFGPNTHCLAEFVLNKCIVGKKDLSHGKENVPVPCVNYYDNSLPEFCSYNTERTPTAGVPLCLDPDFLCGCDCTDDCQDKSKCACWKLTLEGARTIGLDDNVGYVYKRLAEPLPSGIYECNSRCKCKQTCLNRVAQHPLQLKLQVFKTLNRGWGIRALNDVPKGSFLCIYAGNLLTDATANLDGLNEGDEYLAELDYIEVVEQMKEGYEDDIPEHDKKLDRKESGQAESSSEEEESEEEEKASKSDAEDGDFEPGYIPGGLTGFSYYSDVSKRLRKRDKKKQKEEDKNKRDKDGNKDGGEDDCITISDDEELREPSSFAAQAGMGGAFISKYRSVRSLFGRDEACYIMDAKVQGNIGRYLNHSCSPNVFVQNVFVDTHDPRFPWVAFFALSHIRAGTELTWNYNYDVGSVPGKALYCYCGAPNWPAHIDRTPATLFARRLLAAEHTKRHSSARRRHVARASAGSLDSVAR
ncbi:SET domain-containing protein [Phthorimaea operculella]|nr:SET domain-containing protein [Phthorimaea operculella]